MLQIRSLNSFTKRWQKEIILLKDINSRVEKKDRDELVGKYEEDTFNKNGEEFIYLGSQNQLWNFEWILLRQIGIQLHMDPSKKECKVYN